MDKKGQGEQFNWILVIVAGAIILSFFIMFVFKYIELQGKRQDVETLRFFGQGVLSAASKLQVGSGGAAIDSEGDEGLRFGYPVNLGYKCDEDGALVLINQGESAWYKLDDEIVYIDKEESLKSLDGLDLWILPWNYPFHVTNFIYLANSNTKFYLVYDQSTSDFVNDEVELSSVFNAEKIQKNQLKPGSNMKIVYFTSQNPPASEINSMKKNLKDLDFIYIKGDEASFFNLEEKEWSEPVKFYGKEQLYGAILSNNEKNFECNTNRALERVRIISKLYSERARFLGQIDKRAGCQYSSMANALSRYAEGNFELEKAIEEQNLAGAGCIWVF